MPPTKAAHSASTRTDRPGTDASDRLVRPRTTSQAASTAGCRAAPTASASALSRVRRPGVGHLLVQIERADREGLTTVGAARVPLSSPSSGRGTPGGQGSPNPLSISHSPADVPLESPPLAGRAEAARCLHGAESGFQEPIRHPGRRAGHSNTAPKRPRGCSMASPGPVKPAPASRAASTPLEADLPASQAPSGAAAAPTELLAPIPIAEMS